MYNSTENSRLSQYRFAISEENLLGFAHSDGTFYKITYPHCRDHPSPHSHRDEEIDNIGKMRSVYLEVYRRATEADVELELLQLATV